MHVCQFGCWWLSHFQWPSHFHCHHHPPAGQGEEPGESNPLVPPPQGSPARAPLDGLPDGGPAGAAPSPETLPTPQPPAAKEGDHASARPEDQRSAGTDDQPSALRAPWGWPTTLLVMLTTLAVTKVMYPTVWPAVGRIAACIPITWQARAALTDLLANSRFLAWSLLVLWVGKGRHRPRQLGLFPLSLKDGQWGLRALDRLSLCLTLVRIRLALWKPALEPSEVLFWLCTSDAIALVGWMLSLGVVVPLSQGLVFRGFLLPSLGRYLPLWAAVALSALAAAAHRAPLAVHFFTLFYINLILGYLNVREQNLWPSIIFHGLQNVSMLVCFVTLLGK